MELVRFGIGLLALVGAWHVVKYLYNVVDVFVTSRRAGAVIEYKLYVDPDLKKDI